MQLFFTTANKTSFYFSKHRKLTVCFTTVLFSCPDEVRWIQQTTPCSLGQVITRDLPKPRKDTPSPHLTLTPTPSPVRLTPATHLASHMHGQVTLGALTLGTTPTQGN